MESHPSKTRFLPLLVFQIILMGLFFAFTKYNGTDKAEGFEGTHVMIFIGFGYLMTFLKKYCYSALGLNLLLAALVIQWAMLCQNFFHMKDGKIEISKKELVEADIMAATVLISFGALLGVASSLQLLFIAIIETAVGCCNLYLVLNVLKAADAGGSIAIHAYGAYFGLSCSLAMNLMRRRSGKDEEGHESTLEGPTYVSDVTAMIGTIFLWIYWPSFNSAIVESETEYQRAVINTYLSLASASVVTFAMSAIVSGEGKFDMVHIQNSTLAGGVAVGAVANMQITPGGAIAVGMGAGVLSVCGYKYLTPKLAKIGILDTCGVNNLHGMPGIYSGILSAIFAAMATKNDYGNDIYNVFPGMGKARNTTVTPSPEEEFLRSPSEQAVYQLAAVVATLLVSSLAGAVTGVLASIPVCRPLAKSERYDDQVDWELPH